ncbi:class I SAM-dependent methyltransferase [Bradyrhizobium elkanii]|uniref:class I SAM-dependent methyltransferase n=1 Tax=Bradyrhizobium elkanii TaxID=29448 RepID=UPI003D2346A6
MLTLLAPDSVLEYGCGSGRILRLLRSIPGIEVFGADQSETMLREIGSWSRDADWSGRHVYRVDGREPHIPRPDRSIGVVLTNEALLHTPPDVLGGVLTELVRLARDFIIHIEPIIGEPLEHDDHFGCYAHDYAAFYRSRGLQVTVFPNSIGQQSIVLVEIGEKKVDYDLLRSHIDYYSSINQEVQSAYDERNALQIRLNEMEAQASQVDSSAHESDVERIELLVERSTAHLAVQLLKSKANQSAVLRLGAELNKERDRSDRLFRRLTNALVSRHWRPLKLASALRNRYWRIRSHLSGDSLRLTIKVQSESPILIEDIIGDGGAPIPIFLLAAQDGFEGIDDSGRIILRNGSLEIFGSRRWEVMFAPVEFKGDVLLQAGNHNKLVKSQATAQCVAISSVG